MKHSDTAKAQQFDAQKTQFHLLFTCADICGLRHLCVHRHQDNGRSACPEFRPLRGGGGVEIREPPLPMKHKSHNIKTEW